VPKHRQLVNIIHLSMASSRVAAQKTKTKSKGRKRSSSRKTAAKKKSFLSTFFDQLLSRFSQMLLNSIEVVSLTGITLVVLLLLLGSAAHFFAGADLFQNLLPFLFTVLFLCVSLAIFFMYWHRLRIRLNNHSPVFSPILATVLAIAAVVMASHESFYVAYVNVRHMIGGKAEIQRTILAHQVYAAYRRHKGSELLKLVERAKPFSADITAAANAFSLDADLLYGLAAAESSFYPRRSKDGGEGLFQITAVPKSVEQQVAEMLPEKIASPGNHRYNTYMAAATLREYLDRMGGDHILALLAYNIGPENGGLRFIMEHYKAYSFTTIQPYLKSGPRHYPVRVLSYALAFRIWLHHGQLLTYEKEGNATRIQRIAIPGLDGY